MYLFGAGRPSSIFLLCCILWSSINIFLFPLSYIFPDAPNSFYFIYPSQGFFVVVAVFCVRLNNGQQHAKLIFFF